VKTADSALESLALQATLSPDSPWPEHLRSSVQDKKGLDTQMRQLLGAYEELLKSISRGAGGAPAGDAQKNRTH
jgi:hypothetical protein